MAFTIQDTEGTVDAANAYIDVAALRAYALDRGVDLTATLDPALQVAIVKATDFLDTAFQFVGRQRRVEQGTAWPRRDISTVYHAGLPAALLRACSQLALKAAQGTALSTDPTIDPSGYAVSELTTKVGPIEKSTKFAVPAGGVPGTSGSALSKRFPDVELGLRQAGLLSGTGGSGSGRLSRA